MSRKIMRCQFGLESCHLQELPLAPIHDELQSAEIPLPEYVSQYSRKKA